MKRLKYIILSILILYTFTSCSTTKNKETSLYKELKTELKTIKTNIQNKTITYTEYFSKPSKSVENTEKAEKAEKDESPRENNNPIKTELKIENNNINIEEDILINNNIEDKETSKKKLTRNNLSVLLLLSLLSIYILNQLWQKRKKQE